MAKSTDNGARNWGCHTARKPRARQADQRRNPSGISFSELLCVARFGNPARATTRSLLPGSSRWLEGGATASRIRHLQQSPAGVRFLSIEPLIGRIGKLDLAGIDWVIVGGESGPRARPMNADWVREIRDQCIDNSVAFFFKQWGGIRPKSGGRDLDDVQWSQFPIV
ncbi:DUF5131 family protein [Bradyrhizobium manausense]|nr:DUF5131 family protein [Bradyrhizobium manausense]UVO28744.1 phage Gp37/Gp68 family protein [Bradyrhizobium arachidis]